MYEVRDAHGALRSRTPHLGEANAEAGVIPGAVVIDTAAGTRVQLACPQPHLTDGKGRRVLRGAIGTVERESGHGGLAGAHVLFPGGVSLFVRWAILRTVDGNF